MATLDSINACKLEVLDSLMASQVSILDSLAICKSDLLDSIGLTGSNLLDSLAQCKLELIDSISVSEMTLFDSLEICKSDLLDSINQIYTEPLFTVNGIAPTGTGSANMFVGDSLNVFSSDSSVNVLVTPGSVNLDLTVDRIKNRECYVSSDGIDQIEAIDNGGIPIADASFQWVAGEDGTAQNIRIRFDETNNPPTLSYEVTLDVFRDGVLFETLTSDVQGGGFSTASFGQLEFEFGATYLFVPSTTAPSVTIFGTTSPLADFSTPQATWVTDPGDGSLPMVEIVMPGRNTFFVITDSKGAVTVCDEDGNEVPFDPSWIKCSDVFTGSQLNILQATTSKPVHGDTTNSVSIESICPELDQTLPELEESTDPIIVASSTNPQNACINIPYGQVRMRIWDEAITSSGNLQTYENWEYQRVNPNSGEDFAFEGFSTSIDAPITSALPNGSYFGTEWTFWLPRGEYQFVGGWDDGYTVAFSTIANQSNFIIANGEQWPTSQSLEPNTPFRVEVPTLVQIRFTDANGATNSFGGNNGFYLEQTDGTRYTDIPAPTICDLQYGQKSSSCGQGCNNPVTKVEIDYAGTIDRVNTQYINTTLPTIPGTDRNLEGIQAWLEANVDFNTITPTTTGDDLNLEDLTTPGQVDVLRKEFYVANSDTQTLTWTQNGFGSVILEVDECGCGEYDVVGFGTNSGGGNQTVSVTLESGLHKIRITTVDHDGNFAIVNYTGDTDFNFFAPEEGEVTAKLVDLEQDCDGNLFNTDGTSFTGIVANQGSFSCPIGTKVKVDDVVGLKPCDYIEAQGDNIVTIEMPDPYTLVNPYDVTVTNSDGTAGAFGRNANAQTTTADQAIEWATVFTNNTDIPGTWTANGNTIQATFAVGDVYPTDVNTFVDHQISFTNGSNPVETVPNLEWQNTTRDITGVVTLATAHPNNGPSGAGITPGASEANTPAVLSISSNHPGWVTPDRLKVQIQDLDSGPGEFIDFSLVPDDVEGTGGNTSFTVTGSRIDPTANNVSIVATFEGGITTVDAQQRVFTGGSNRVGYREFVAEWDYESSVTVTEGGPVKLIRCGENEFTDLEGNPVAVPSSFTACGVNDAIEEAVEQLSSGGVQIDFGFQGTPTGGTIDADADMTARMLNDGGALMYHTLAPTNFNFGGNTYSTAINGTIAGPTTGNTLVPAGVQVFVSKTGGGAFILTYSN
jgi:hypothetical protein